MPLMDKSAQLVLLTVRPKRLACGQCRKRSLRTRPLLHRCVEMIALYCANATSLTAIVRAVPAMQPPAVSCDWPHFERIARHADCSIIAMQWLAVDSGAARITDLKAKQPRHPIVLVTAKDADNLRLLRAVIVEEVVWWHEIDRTIWATICRATLASDMNRIATAIRVTTCIPPLLRHALARACESATPVTSTSELAKLAGCHRRTLWYQWRKVADGDSSARLEDVLSWILLLRAVALRSAGDSWTVIACNLHMHEHTLARLTKQHLGLTVREVSSQADTVTSALVDRLLISTVGKAHSHIS